jgi:hypothetical protein
MHFTHAVNAPGIKEHALRGRGLTGINVRNNADVPRTFDGIINTHKGSCF